MNSITSEQKDPHYYQHFKRWMLPFIEDGPNCVLDIGCAAGRFGQVLMRTGKAKEMHGIELLESAGTEAAKLYSHVQFGDIEQMDLSYNCRFNYVICGDILEHLRDPYRITRLVLEWLKPGGALLVCLPNVRNYKVLFDLLVRGKWEYTSAGIMDRTHLRFFTESSLRRMLEDAGFQVYHQHMVIDGKKKKLANRLSLQLFDGFLGSQIFSCGRKPN